MKINFECGNDLLESKYISSEVNDRNKSISAENIERNGYVFPSVSIFAIIDEHEITLDFQTIDADYGHSSEELRFYDAHDDFSEDEIEEIETKFLDHAQELFDNYLDKTYIREQPTNSMNADSSVIIKKIGDK